MTTTKNDRIEVKIDQLTEMVSNVKNEITEIKTTIIEREKMDNLKHNSLEKEISLTNKRVEGLEDNQKWLIRSIIGSVITALMGIILSVVK